MLTNEKVHTKTHRQHERFTFVRQKTIKIVFFLIFSQVFDNILQNLTLIRSGKCAMAFTCQKYFTCALASALISVASLKPWQLQSAISCRQTHGQFQRAGMPERLCEYAPPEPSTLLVDEGDLAKKRTCAPYILLEPHVPVKNKHLGANCVLKVFQSRQPPIG